MSKAGYLEWFYLPLMAPIVLEELEGLDRPGKAS
jgi:hypothetical protein